MNKVNIIRKHIGNDEFYDINGTSMLTNILNAMEEYKEQEVKKCSIPDVIVACSDCKWATDGNKSEHQEICKLCVNFSEHAL